NTCSERACEQARAEPRSDLAARAAATAVAHDHRRGAGADPGRRRVLAVAHRPQVARAGHRSGRDSDRVHRTPIWCPINTKSRSEPFSRPTLRFLPVSHAIVEPRRLTLPELDRIGNDAIS